MEGRGYQFVHIEGYARKADARGRSVDYVLSEAERRPGSCPHVESPEPPDVVFGLSLVDLRTSHDRQAATALATIAGGKTRKIRQDQLTLMTVVASHPATMAEVRDSPEIAAEVAAWEQRVLAWLRGQWGDNLASVIRHVDEKHAHLHAYVLPRDADMRARRLHPGVAAKENTKSAALAEGAEAKAANAAGDHAYRRAMRAMQDGFWRSVGIPCALARIGPARRRLTRAEWHAEKAGVAAAAEAQRAAEAARADAEAARQAAAMVTGAANAKKAAAESLQVRASAAAERAQAAIRTAREQAIKAKAAADAAEAAQAKAEQRTRWLAARGQALIDQARGEARRILGSARAEAERVRTGARGIGVWVGALLHGLRGMAPAAVAREAAEVARAEEQAVAAGRVALARIEAERSQKALQQAETRLAAISEAAASLGTQRDRLAHELDRLRSGSAPGNAPTPGPR
ncbi:hypothetical protein [Roseomonas sp. 18066]|uniref:hypothetical protein n=1 Tax=Roseomonas sp. 18066 TaxID=2681412 RepID=UPI001358D452|nr:hypothetical protein [Roseomonas sp. 18066]